MYRYRRPKNQPYKKFALNTIIVALAVVIVSIAVSSITKQLGDSEQANADPQSADSSSYYNSKAESSQGNEAVAKAPITTSKPSSSPTKSPTPTSTPSEEPSATPEPEESLPPADTYRVTIFQEKITVFKNGGDEPFMTLDLPISLLPEEERNLLEEGIELESTTAMRAFLEDYE